MLSSGPTLCEVPRGSTRQGGANRFPRGSLNPPNHPWTDSQTAEQVLLVMRHLSYLMYIFFSIYISLASVSRANLTCKTAYNIQT